MSKRFWIYVSIVLLSACATPRPDNINNVCKIYKQYPKWYWSTEQVARRWKVPQSIQMAIIYQESRFNSIAKPPRTKLLWIIPWTRPSSSYGYTQALDSTWHLYKKDTGKYFARRDNFHDAVDFIGWYGYKAYKRAGISRRDPYRLYLAYHEGVGGYQRGTYRRKAWLMSVARKVARQSRNYEAQLARCKSQLKDKPWWRFW